MSSRLGILALTLLSMGYYFLPSSNAFVPFLVLFTLQFAIYGLIAQRGGAGLPGPLALVIIGAINRLILIPTTPVLENDFYRYLWDGRVIAHGINPYLFAPGATELDFLNVHYRHLIGWPDIRTIYPPLAQYLFGALHFIAPDSLGALKLNLVAFEIATGLVLLGLSTSQQNRNLICFLYFLNPLLLKEIANSAHLDAIPIFFTTAAVALFIKSESSKIPAWIALGLGVCSKSYPIVLLPLFWKLDRNWRRGVIAFALTVSALYLPLFDGSLAILGGWGAFSAYWIFNAGVFKIINALVNLPITTLSPDWTNSDLGKLIITNDYPAKVIAGAIFASFLIVRTRALRSLLDLPIASLSVLGALLLVSPIVNAWYVLWLLPFACLTINLPWLSFTYLVVAAYSWFWSPEFAPIFRWIEYLLLLSLLVHSYVNSIRNRKHISGGSIEQS